jgi:two-component system, chemotaxis family, protein-glutamate methylesterase/glutaminase
MKRQRIRVLVVDDSAVMREVLRDLISAAPDIELAGSTAGGQEALDQIEAAHPDVVTLDVQMPGMDGLAALDAIFARRPLPVIMVSGLTTAGAAITFDALNRGALDYVAKPDAEAGTPAAFGEELLQKIRWAAEVDVPRVLANRQERIRRRRQSLWAPRTAKPAPELVAGTMAETCIAVGISTGGPPALSALFEALRPPMPPIVVVQHMPPQFTGPLASRLDGLAQLSVKEAEADDVLLPNRVLIAPGGRHLTFRRSGGAVKAVLTAAAAVSGHRPSIDVLMRSAAAAFGPRCLGVIMTGMGRDGVEGCAAIRAAGGCVLGQDEASSDVYGMNKLAHAIGHVDRQFSLDNAAAVITREVQRLSAAGPSS